MPGNPGGVPEWAAPHDHWAPSSSPSGRNGVDGSDIQPHAGNPGGGLPGDGSRNIPVDGGLAWLLAAGAGYAAHRLRKKDGDADADDAPLP